MVAHFRWVTEWSFDAPAEAIWAILSDAERYPSWWPGFESVRTVSGSGGIGTISEHVVAAGGGLRLRFRMTVEDRRDPEFVRMAVTGDSEGVTEWHVRRLDERVTSVTHVWDIELRRPFLRLSAGLPGAGMFFHRRHRATMAKGRQNLERLLSGKPGTTRQTGRNTRT